MTDAECLTQEFIQELCGIYPQVTRWRCIHCGSSQTIYRVRTRDIKCKKCKQISPLGEKK